MTTHLPYTYLIGWSKLNIWYYGVRWHQKCHPDDLWKTYFTSSKYVKKFREQYGEPDIIQIRKTFDSPEKAKLWEDKVLFRLNVTHDSRFLNCSNNNSFRGIARFKNKSTPWNKGVAGAFSHTDESKQKIREARTGKIFSTEAREKLSDSKKNLVAITNGENKRYINKSEQVPSGWHTGCPDSINQKISATLKGKKKPKRSEEHKLNLSKAAKGNPKPNVSKTRKNGKWIVELSSGKTTYLCGNIDLPEGWIYGRKLPI